MINKIINLVNIETGKVAKYAVTVEEREVWNKPVWETRLVEEGKRPYKHCWVDNSKEQASASLNQAVGKIMFQLASDHPENGYTVQISKNIHPYG